MADPTKTGLRLLEIEAGIAENVESNSPELVDYETTRTHGQAIRIAMLVRGQDVIEDEAKLKKIVTGELKITVPEYNEAKRLLQEVDILEEKTIRGQQVLVEKVQRLDHASNYRRMGESWQSKRRNHKEEALVDALDSVIAAPRGISDIDAFAELKPKEREAVLELARNAAVLDSVTDDDLLYSPLVWDLDPKKFAAAMAKVKQADFRRVLDKTRKRPGIDLSIGTDSATAQLISAGVLPTYTVKSSGQEKAYSFAPYAGALLTSAAQKSVLEKARAIVACLRFGSEAATVSKIRNPAWILQALMDKSRNYRVGNHSELKEQYGMLVKKGIGKIQKVSSDRYAFELIPTEDNLLACKLAQELITTGEVMGDKDAIAAQAALQLVTGEISHPIREVKLAKKKRPARADDLADLVEAVRQVK